MKMKVKLDEGALLPRRAHPQDAGLDIFSREEMTVPARGSAVFHTGVHTEIPAGHVGFIKSKSGLNVKYGLVSEGVIDWGYTGELVVKVYNHSERDHVIRAGDKLTQLVVLPIAFPEPVEVETLEETERGERGFGSTGR